MDDGKAFKHGVSGYSNHKCRCDICKAAKHNAHVKYYSDPSVRERTNKYQSKLRKDPDHMLYQKDYLHSYVRTPEYKQKAVIMRSDPLYKMNHKRYCSTPERREKQRLHRLTPGYKRKKLNTHLKKMYNITSDQFSDMLLKQGGVCAICGETCNTYGRLSVDHDHKTGKVRALLCNKCNKGIGCFGERLDVLVKAIDYLEFWN